MSSELVDQSSSATEPVLLHISEQDIDHAREAFDLSRQVWDDREPFAYTLQIGATTVNEIEIDVDEGGKVVAERVILDDGNADSLSRSVDEVFDRVEAAISAFESGEFDVPTRGECGRHVNVMFDEALGYPTYWDELGPCDDGVGIRVEVRPN